MSIFDLKTALEIVRRTYKELPEKTEEQLRVKANLGCAKVYLEDGITALRMTARGVKPECIAEEILSQLEEV